MLLRLLQGQQEQLIRLQEMVGAQMQGQQQLTAVTQSVAAASNSRPRGLIDVKAAGRPNPLGRTLEEATRNWRQWSYRLELWLASQFPEARQVLGWARERGENEIPLASLESTSITGVARESLLEFNRQLEVVLGTLTVVFSTFLSFAFGTLLSLYFVNFHWHCTIRCSKCTLGIRKGYHLSSEQFVGCKSPQIQLQMPLKFRWGESQKGYHLLLFIERPTILSLPISSYLPTSLLLAPRQQWNPLAEYS